MSKKLGDDRVPSLAMADTVDGTRVPDTNAASGVVPFEFAPTRDGTPPLVQNPALAPTISASEKMGPQTPQDPALANTLASGRGHGSGSIGDRMLLAPLGTMPDPLKGWDRYEMIRPLGQGGMGTVFLAKDRKLGRMVALKFLRVPSADAAERLLQEARAQARLDHTNICKVFEVGEFQHQPYIAMEYIDGPPLNQVLNRLTIEQKVLIVSQIALAVQAAHTQGILHRDLKPANIMLCETKGESAQSRAGTYRPVLMDFGLARDCLGPQRLTQTGVIMGTPHYMAPEQARGMARSLDRRADIYSIGAMLYELLCGKPPFDAENEVDLLMAVLHQEPTQIRQKEPNIPIDLEVITHKCLRKEPAHRYDSAQALADDLGRYLRGEPILARPATTLYKLRRLASVHKGPVAVGTVIFVAIVSLFGMWGQARAQRLRQAARAAEQERLATRLGQSVTEMRLFLRVAYSLPPHDLRREYDLVRKKLVELEEQMKVADPFLHGTIQSAIGQGHLALEEYASAVEHLQRALDLGENSSSTHLSLAEALLNIYRGEVKDARSRFDPEERKGKMAKLNAEYLPRARKSLQMVKDSDTLAKPYVEALLLRYADTPKLDQALSLLEVAAKENPWQLEPIVQKLTLVGEQKDLAMEQDQDFGPEKRNLLLKQVEESISMARSYPGFYAAHIELVKDLLDIHTSGQAPQEEYRSTYEREMEYVKTLLALNPNEGRTADLATIFAVTCVFRQTFLRQPELFCEEDARHFIAEAKKILPVRASTFMTENRYHQAMLNHFIDDAEKYNNHALWGYEAIKRALELEPENAGLIHRMALSLQTISVRKVMKQEDGKPELLQAIEYEKRAIQIQPKMSNYQNALAAFLMYLATLEQERGRDPSAMWEESQKVLESTMKMTPNAILPKYNLQELLAAKIERFSGLGQDVKGLRSELHAMREGLLKKYPNDNLVHAAFQESVFKELALDTGDADRLSEVEALLKRLDDPLFAGFQPGRRQDLRAFLETCQLQEWTKSKKNPESALASIFDNTRLENVLPGGTPMIRKDLRAMALRHFTEYLLSTPSLPPFALLKKKGIPTTPSAAIAMALALYESTPDSSRLYMKKGEAEKLILLSLKARTLPASEGMELQRTTQTEMKKLLGLRPDFKKMLTPYLRTENENP
ncbi:MAG TPA: serine/threonine-protein kinase [Pseudomonadota bacterium]|nr:serine/threonine-protein kinase [Pseudomonadota bacterium]